MTVCMCLRRNWCTAYDYILPKIMIKFYIVYVGSSSPGTVEIELQYNNLNPLHPVLLVKLTDVIFYSTKGLSSGTIHLL